MSAFWSAWVMGLATLNLGVTLFLFVWGMRVRIPTLPDGTTGHIWAHGVLRESVRKLPLWWVAFSAAMFVIGVGYLVLYPGFGGYEGVRGWTSSAELAQDTAENNAKLETVLARVRPLSIEQLALEADAAAIGRTLFQDNCAACHGREAHGNQLIGAPSLTDADSLYGADSDAILSSIAHGRNGVMPPLGGALGREGVKHVAAYVLSLGGRQAPADWVASGKTHFNTLCVACHEPDAQGNPQLGAPNLTDAVWLYGDDFADVAASVRDGRSGVMPAWSGRLSADQTRLIAAWLYANAQQRSEGA